MNLQERIAARAVAHIPPGSVVNLGIGIPTFVADHLPLDSVALQTENGLLRSDTATTTPMRKKTRSVCGCASRLCTRLKRATIRRRSWPIMWRRASSNVTCARWSGSAYATTCCRENLTFCDSASGNARSSG